MSKLKMMALAAAMAAALTAAPAFAAGEDAGEYAQYGIALSKSEISEGLKGAADLLPVGAMSDDHFLGILGLVYAPVESETFMKAQEEPDSLDASDVDYINYVEDIPAYAMISDLPIEEAAALSTTPEYVDTIVDASEEVAFEEGYHYYFVSGPGFDAQSRFAIISELYPDKLPAEEVEGWAEDVEKAIDNFKTALKESEHFPPIDVMAECIGQTLSFDTEDLEGIAVSSADLFAENEITMINLWGTWCPACMGEMEELAKINKEFSEKGCGIVGVEMEYDWTDDTIAEAKETIEKNGIEYPNVKIPSENWLFSAISSYPTSIFVDKDGKILAAPVIGAQPDEYREKMEELLGERADADDADAADAADAAASDEDAGAADAAAAAEDAGAADAAASAYTVRVTDAAGEPLEGAVIQFCNDDSCYLGTTDADGAAVFEYPEMVYTIHVLQAPEGYKLPEEEYASADTYGEIVIELEAE